MRTGPRKRELRRAEAAKLAEGEFVPLLRRVVGQSVNRYWRSYVVGAFFLIVSSATTAGAAWMMRDVVNQIFIDKNATLLWLISFGVIVLFAVRGGATYLQSTILSRVGNRIVADNQKQIYDHLLTMDVGFFANHASSDLITRVSRGAQAAKQAVELVVISLGRDLLTLVGLCAVMVVQAPILSLLSLLIGPPVVIGVVKIGKRIRKLANSELQSAAHITGVIQETTQGSRIIKSYVLDAYLRGRMAKAVNDVETRSNKIAALQARTNPLMETLAGFAVGGVILVAGWQTIYHDQTPGEFMSFITALLLAYEPAKRLARLHVGLQSTLVALRSMFALMDTPAARTELPTGTQLSVSRGCIEFSGVSFGYRADTPVLRNVGFTVEEGQKLALVGPSGGGKSTILSLVQRFYDVDAGQITIDGQDIRSVDPDSLRRAMSFVSQDTYLFAGSLADNIRLGRPGASDEEVRAAIRNAHAEDFIMALPKGADTHVGENGVQLSGGQRQRIAIARALLKDAPIILLDEATSALDSETERAIQDALARLTKGRTTMVIAHRLSTVIDADRILVVDRGRIVETGRHAELIRKGGLYERLSRLQFSEDRALVEGEPA